MFFSHSVPRAGIPDLERQTLRVRPVAQNDRIATPLDRAVDVGPEHEPVVDGDLEIPIDPHPIGD
jgi:hypothetical protein